MPNTGTPANRTRRALLKVAPAVCTVPFGAEVAAASLQCDQKSATLLQSNPPVLLSQATDGWVRRQFKVREFKLTSGAWFPGIQIDTSVYSLTATTATKLADGTVDLTKTRDFSTTTYRYGLIDYVDSMKSFRVYPTATTVVNPIAGGSCLGSLVPGVPFVDKSRNLV